MPAAVKEFDFEEFRKGLEFFSDDASWLVCQKCCRGGDAHAVCDIRDCCRERDLAVCFDCDDYPCDKTNRPGMRERGEEYKRIGKRKWLDEQIRIAEKGFESHLEKYVTLLETEWPIESIRFNKPDGRD